MTELIINKENFSQYFREIKSGKFESGEIIACYTAVALLDDSAEKRNLINLLTKSEKVLPAVSIMRNYFNACEKDAHSIPREICDDLINGMSFDKVCEKPYKYILTKYFYTKPEYMPKDNPHWSSISILNNNFMEENNGIKISSRIIS